MSIQIRSQRIEADGPLLLIHGGAWDIPDSALPDHRSGLDAALEAGQSEFSEGREAVDVVTETVAALEAHTAFNAGRGAMLNQQAEAELDAGVMDGTRLAFGSVAGTTHLTHPVRVARRLLTVGEGRVRMLIGRGAERFAESQGFDLVSNDQLVCSRELDRYERIRAQADREHPSSSFLPGTPHTGGADTVGCVVRDASGRLAAATSTGGTPFKPPGRVGDSPLPGAGFYADEHVAVSATGWGEAIATVGLARDVREQVVDGAEAMTAARGGLRRMKQAVRTPEGEGATGGCIVVTSDDAAYAFTTPRMARGWMTGGEMERAV